MTPLDRMLLFLTCLLASYQIVVGIDKLGSLPIAAYTIGFGVLLVAALLLIILGFEVLESPVVVIVSTVIPLSLSLGLAWEHLTSLRIPYLVFAVVGILAVIVTRPGNVKGKLPLIVLAGVHGISGTIIALLPVFMAARGQMRPGFAVVGAGGALIGLAGILLTFESAGKPILARAAIMKFLPGLLLVLMAAFVAGFKLG